MSGEAMVALGVLALLASWRPKRKQERCPLCGQPKKKGK